MVEPQVTRPIFPPGYVNKPGAMLAWARVQTQLATAKNYWLCSVRPNGRPHVIPKWAVWVGGKIYFDGSPETRHARNIAANPHVSLHLESGDQAVIVEGTTAAIARPAPELAQQVAEAYRLKYAAFGYAPNADQWDGGGLFEITMRTVIAWTSFANDPTKFVFERE